MHFQTGQFKGFKAPVSYFGVAIVNKQLITGEGSIINKVWVQDRVSSTWIQPFPVMFTARWCPSAVGYKKWMLVVGVL